MKVFCNSPYKTSKKTACFLIGLIALSCSAFSQTEPAETPKKLLTGSYTLQTLTNKLSQKFGTKIFIKHSHSTVPIAVNTPLENISYGDFLSILKMHNYTAIKSDNNIKIIKLNNARDESLPIKKAGDSFPADQFVTGLISLKKGCPMTILAGLRPAVPKESHLTAFKKTRSLLLTDTFANFKRIEELIKLWDEQHTEVQNCQYSSTK